MAVNSSTIPAATGQCAPNARPKLPHRLAGWAIPLILALLYLMQCVWFIATQSMVYDEPVHIYTGLEAWRYHRFAQWNDQPPLARMLCTLPFLSRGWQIVVEGKRDGFQVPRIQPHPVRVATRARWPIVLLGLALGIWLWASARSLMSAGAANLALALFVLTPAVIANFSLATTDGAGTLFIFVTAMRLLRWRRHPSWGHTLTLGAVLGLLLLSKFYTPPFFLLALGAMLVLKPLGLRLNPKHWNWAQATAALVLALLIVWAGYFFHVSHLSIHDGRLIATFPHREPIIKQLAGHANFRIWIPAGEYLEGLRTVWFHNRRGHASFFLGEVSRHGGWKSFYVVVLLLKWPPLVLLLGLAALIQAARRQWTLSSDWRVLAPFPLLYFLLATFSKIDIGDRHLLPVYPFLLLFTCGLYEWARRYRWATALLLVTVLLNAADALRYAPDYLSYFTPFVSSSESYKLLTASSLDWGQGLLAVRAYERAHEEEKIWLAYFGSVQPAVYGVQARALEAGQHATGTLIISATNLSGQYLDDPGGFHWVLDYPRIAILNHSLYVFRVPGKEPSLEPTSESGQAFDFYGALGNQLATAAFRSNNQRRARSAEGQGRPQANRIMPRSN